MSSDKNKKTVTGWRIIAMSGTTADGREIRPEHIQQMADSYNPETYAAELEQVKTDLAESAQFAAGLLQKVEKLEAELEKFRAELAAAETGERAPHVGAPDEAGLSW